MKFLYKQFQNSFKTVAKVTELNLIQTDFYGAKFCQISNWKLFGNCLTTVLRDFGTP